MTNRLIFICLIFIVAGSLVYGLSGQSHKFSESQCIDCHSDSNNDPFNFQPTIDRTCNSCHLQLENKKSHPSGVLPTMDIPKDMPLIEGKLACVTCHYAHPKEDIIFFETKHNYLRRQVKGVYFCIECHKIDDKGHIVFENVHIGSYKVTNQNTRIDRMSLECIECHDRHMKAPVKSLGAGLWKHFKKEFNHSIGASYKQTQMRKMRDYKPSHMLNKELRLFNDNIGCGTCHNIYSKNKNMLVIENRGSKLCLSCHIK